jgi:hypothetical protein
MADYVPFFAITGGLAILVYVAKAARTAQSPTDSAPVEKLEYTRPSDYGPSGTASLLFQTVQQSNDAVSAKAQIAAANVVRTNNGAMINTDGTVHQSSSRYAVPYEAFPQYWESPLTSWNTNFPEQFVTRDN